MGVPDSNRDRLLSYLNYAKLKNKVDKVQFYKELFYKNFNIVARMLIPMEECKRFCQEEAGRRFKKKYWNPITIKIAIA